ncbi:autotransporter outer membrane beta-barrel domain-containing protein [Caballeronia sp. M23-90]
MNSARNITLAGNGTFNTDSGTTTTDSGAVSGAGGLIKNGAGTLELDGVASHQGGTTVNGGTLVLGGNNTYTGGTSVNGPGTLQVSSDANLGDASSNLMLNGGTLHTTGDVNSARNITLAGNGTFNTDSGTTTTDSGAVSGAGGLIKNGAGTLKLDGVASHQGGTTVNGGTLVLGGNNTYTGGTTLNGGSLHVSSDANLGDPSNAITFHGGDLTVTQSMTTARGMILGAEGASLTTLTGVTLVENGDMSGVGGLQKNGGGTLIVGGNNTFTGGTLINGGVIQINSGSSLGTGAIVLNGGMLNTTATLGTGQQIIVSGASGVNVDEGTTTVLSGQIASSGDASCFTKMGKGTLSMTGSATLSHGTCVADGMLRANGDLISDVSVYAAGTLRGVGLVNGSMNVDGRLAPGNSPGTLVVNGTVTMNGGSVFEADVDGTGTGTGAGNYSRLLVTGAGHQFIANGTLQPLLRNITGNASNTFVPNLGDTYRIVTAEGGIAGRFSGLDQPAEGLAAGTRFQAFYNVLGSNSIDLRVTPLTYAGYLSGSNGNVRSVAGLLDATMTSQDAATATDRQSQLLYAVAGADAAQLPQVAKGLVGEIHADMAAAAPEAGRATQQQVTDHLMNGPATDATHGEMLWANVSHTNDHTSADEHASGFTARNNQVTVGADIMRSAATRVGVGFSHADVVVATDGGSGSIQDNLGFIYGQQSVGNVLMDGVFGYGTQSWSSDRSDVIGTTNGLSTGNHGHDIFASLGVRLPVLLSNYRIEPFARALFQHIQRDGSNEGDASVSALTLNDYSASGTRLLAGVSGGSISQDPLMQFATYKFNVAIGTDTGSLIRTSIDGSLVGQPLSVQAPHSGRVFGQFGLGGTLRVAKQGYLFAGAQTEVAARRTSYSLTGGVRIGF